MMYINPSCPISGVRARQISGKLIQNRASRKQIWTSFPEIGLAHAPDIDFLKNFWMSFPGFANNG